MKKILLILLLVFISRNCFAEDYWVFIRLEDRPGVTFLDDAGRSKKGDVVHIQKAVEGQQPTEREKQEYAIVTVPDLTDQEIEDLLTRYKDEAQIKVDPNEPDKYLAFRKNKLDVDKLKYKKGFSPTKEKKKDITDNTKNKTALDLITYRAKQEFYANVQRPLKIVSNAVVPKAFAANISKICAVGSNCTDENYNSLVTWEDAVDGDLVTDTRQETAEVYDDDGDLTAKFIIDGSTTNSSYYMEVTAPSAERHNGTHSGGGATINASGNPTISIFDTYSRVSWLILKGQTGTGFLNGAIEYSGGGNSQIKNMIIYKPQGLCVGAWITDPITIQTVTCVDPGTGGFYSNSSNSGQNLADATVWSAGGYGVQSNNYDCDNVASFDSATADYTGSACGGSSSRWASSDTSGQTGYRSFSSSNQFVSLTSGSENLSLKSGADLISAGATPTPGANVDNKGTSRPVDTYDIGAYEFVAATPLTTIHGSNLHGANIN